MGQSKVSEAPEVEVEASAGRHQRRRPRGHRRQQQNELADEASQFWLPTFQFSGQWVALRGARAGETDGGSTGHAPGSTLPGHLRGVHATACPSAQRRWSKRAAAYAPLVHLSLTYPTHTLRPVPGRQLYAVPHPQPHHPYLFNIQDGRRNARCAALSTWGERTQPAVATAWFELLI